jgi:CRISPR-associated endonuclease/helicase Cas3
MAEATFLGHSANDLGEVELLRDHLRTVAERAAGFANVFGMSDEARIAGLLHDLGKYGDRFQRRLRGTEQGVDHWSQGAWEALRRYRQSGIAVALAVGGHHVGLQKADKDSLGATNPVALKVRHPFQLSLPDEDEKTLVERLEGDALSLPASMAIGNPTQQPSAAWMLRTRMLFSALVDADFLETEAHFAATAGHPRPYRKQAPVLNGAAALDATLRYIEELAASSVASEEVNSVRRDLLAECMAAAARPPGLFTLTAPTGSGKTLAMLAFALKHAVLHGLRRVVTVIPYLTIIEQTAAEYRRALEGLLGDEGVLEHHSLAGTRDGGGAGDRGDDQGELDRRRRELSENWDAPVVVTTSVQLLESLFANRPSTCRKLHRLANSVILFDEVQTLPSRLAVPTLGALSELAACFGSTIVFATATQPAFGHLDSVVRDHSVHGWAPQEVTRPDTRLFERTRRCSVEWPDLEKRISWDELAPRLVESGSCLCIVNVKRHAVELAAAVTGLATAGRLFHLSTSMCPVHRQRALDDVRTRLVNRMPTILVSTQCVEAGVDVDFPAVFRAFGPLDAIAQAAGRCNRHGRLDGPGHVVVFLPEDDKYPPGGGYGQAASVTRMILRERGASGMDLNDPALFDGYFRRLYDLTRPENLNQALVDGIKCKDFPAVAAGYRLIDQDTVNVLVPYDTMAWEALREDLVRLGRLTRGWLARARPHTINVFRNTIEHTPNLQLAPIWKGGAADDWFICTQPGDYDPLLGYRPKDNFTI